MAHKIKVIHTHANGTSTNFGIEEWEHVPDVGDLVKRKRGDKHVTCEVTKVTGPDDDGVTTIAIKDV